jgi:biopolymer transport protein ExbD
MSVRLDHGEDTLDEMHEINVTPFIDVMLVLLAAGYLKVALVGLEKTP